jgi:hypothetical protein
MTCQTREQFSKHSSQGTLCEGRSSALVVFLQVVKDGQLRRARSGKHRQRKLINGSCKRSRKGVTGAEEQTRSTSTPSQRQLREGGLGARVAARVVGPANVPLTRVWRVMLLSCTCQPRCPAVRERASALSQTECGAGLRF